MVYYGEDDDGGEEGMLDGTWAPAIANRQISHGQRRYPIVTANAGRSFVTGARDGHSDYSKIWITHPLQGSLEYIGKSCCIDHEMKLL